RAGAMWAARARCWPETARVRPERRSTSLRVPRHLAHGPLLRRRGPARGDRRQQTFATGGADDRHGPDRPGLVRRAGGASGTEPSPRPNDLGGYARSDDVVGNWGSDYGPGADDGVGPHFSHDDRAAANPRPCANSYETALAFLVANRNVSVSGAVG